MGEEQKKSMVMLYWSLIATRGVFVYILYYFIEINPINDQTMTYLLTGVAIVFGVISHFLFVKSYSQSFLEDKIVNKLFQAPTPKEFSDKEARSRTLFTNFYTISIVAWALSQLVAVIGLILPLVGGSQMEGMGLIIASALLGLTQRLNFDRFARIVP